MARYRVRLAPIRRRLPSGYQLPRSFDSFAQLCRAASYGDYGFFEIATANPNRLVGLKVDDRLVPFLVLGDGGVVAFWFRTRRTPCIVWFDSEGQYGVAGATWTDFLVRFQKGLTAVADIDDCRRRAPSLPATQRHRVAPRRRMEQLYRDLDAWLDRVGDLEAGPAISEPGGGKPTEERTIRPLVGVGPVVFGMTRAQVKSRAGAPDSWERDDIMDCLYEWRGRVKYEYGPRRLVSIQFPRGAHVYFDGIALNSGRRAVGELATRDPAARTKRGWTNCPSLGVCLGGRGRDRCTIVYGPDRLDFYAGFLDA